MLFCPRTFFYFFPQTEKFSPGIKSGKSGIGLALTKEIVHLHRGTIRAYNGETGAVFEITLPMAR